MKQKPSFTGIIGHRFKTIILICLNKHYDKLENLCSILTNLLKNNIKHDKRINTASRNGKHQG